MNNLVEMQKTGRLQKRLKRWRDGKLRESRENRFAIMKTGEARISKNK